jgi:hypothetical protein
MKKKSPRTSALFFSLAIFFSGSASNSAIPPHMVLGAAGARLTQTHVPWSTDINGSPSTLRTRIVTVLAGQTVRVQSPRDLDVQATAGALTNESPRDWTWTAPARPNLYSLDLIPSDGTFHEKMVVNIFVMVPATEIRKGKLRGYPIGAYKPGEGAYAQPDGFIEVTRANQDTWVSPHFQLKQFVCKQSGAFPKYMRLSENLLTKLELILERLNQNGFPARTLSVLSGFRTPHYNRGLGNVANSRHMYGDAADVFVDNNHDGRMDDLNRDGRSNAKDARIFARIVEELERDLKGTVPVGGMGMYGNTHSHGPFIHVDARGSVARWASS